MYATDSGAVDAHQRKTPHKGRRPVYRILALDGGGVRGVFQVAFLDRIEQTFSLHMSKVLHLVAGTSVGSILAMAVAINYPLGKLLDIVRDSAPTIFPRHPNEYVRGLRYARRAGRYDILTLHDVCRSIFKERTLADVPLPVVVPASGLDRFGHRTFTNMHNGNPADRKLTVADIVTASAAAPTFFGAFRPSKQESWFVDGGLWANSPALQAILECHSGAGVPLRDMHVLAIGTGDFQRSLSPEDYQRKIAYSPKRVVGTIDLMIAAQATYGLHAATQLVGSDRVVSVNPRLSGFIELDDHQTAFQRLLPMAESEFERQLRALQSFVQIDDATTHNSKLDRLRPALS